MASEALDPPAAAVTIRGDDDAGNAAVGGGGSANTAGRGERLERVLDDLEVSRLGGAPGGGAAVFDQMNYS